jgi:hypothetical protein
VYNKEIEKIAAKQVLSVTESGLKKKTVKLKKTLRGRNRTTK